MKIAIIRLGLAIREKESSYNVQEIGLAKAMIGMGHNVEVCYFLDKIHAPELSNKNSFVTYYPCYAIGHQILINTSYFEGNQWDGVIIFCDNKMSANILIKWCKKEEIKYLCYYGLYHTDSTNIINKFFDAIITKTNYKWLSCSKNVTKTKAVRDVLLKNGLPVTKVIPVGLDENLLVDVLSDLENVKFKDELNIREGDLVLLFVGRLTKAKNPLMAIKILEKLNDIGVPTSLVLIGQGILEDEVLKQINESIYEEKIVYRKKVQYNEMYKYYSISDVFMNFSSIEIFGMAILEAMYYGCGVVAHKAPGPNDIIKNGVNGMLLDTNDVDEWINAVKIANTSRIVSAAMFDCREQYTWKSIADKFLDALGEDNEKLYE